MVADFEIQRVEVDEGGGVVRVFRTVHDAILFEHDHPLLVKTIRYRDAVEEVRRRVYERSKGACEWCGKTITWKSLHMHEQLPRGNGGEISLSNSAALCARCHLDVAHANRQWGGGPK